MTYFSHTSTATVEQTNSLAPDGTGTGTGPVPLAGYPIGAGPENLSHCADFQDCSLNPTNILSRVTNLASRIAPNPIDQLCRENLTPQPQIQGNPNAAGREPKKQDHNPVIGDGSPAEQREKQGPSNNAHKDVKAEDKVSNNSANPTPLSAAGPHYYTPVSNDWKVSRGRSASI